MNNTSTLQPTLLPDTNIPTFHKYKVMYEVLQELRIKHKRRIFHLMREYDALSINTFFPHYGFTAGEFSTWHLLTESVRKSSIPTSKESNIEK